MRQLALFLCLWLMAGTAMAAYPKVQSITGKNTPVTAWVAEDRYLPIISLQIAFKDVGYAHDPKGKSGLAYLVTTMMLEGTADKDAKTLKEKFEEMATSLAFSVDQDHFYVSMTALAPKFDASLALLSEILTRLQCDEASLKKNIRYVNTLRDQSEQQPEYIAGRSLAETLFAGHPYSQPKYGTAKTLSTLTTGDVMTYVKTRLARSNMVIALAGDVNMAALPSLLDTRFGPLPEKTATSAIPTPSWPEGPRVITIEKEIPQSVVLFAFPGILRQDPRFYATYVMNQILGGGGFEARLMDRIREKNGLVYSAYSYLETYAKAGLVRGGMATSDGQVKEAISLLKKEIASMAETGVTVEELQHAKDYLLYSFPLKLTKNSHVATILLSMQLEGLGQDFLEERNDYVRQVNLADVNTTARTFLDANKMVLVIVGKSR